MSDRGAGREPRVTPLELFFDLVFVFAITQVTSLLTARPDWGGVLRAVLLLAMLWWAWSAYAWLTNALDPDEGGVRLVMLGAIAAMLVASLAAPNAFGRNGVLFGVAYLVVRILHLALFALAGRGDPHLSRAVLRLVPTVAVAGGLLVLAGFLHGAAQVVCWAVAAVVDYGGPLIGHMRGWAVSTRHFTERYGQIILIALGESVVAIGLGARGLALDAGVIGAALLGFCVVACLWWAYFDWVVYVAHTRLAAATGTRRAALARDAYSYLHLPMVAGIVLLAFGSRTTLHGTSQHLALVPAFGLVGGVAVYLLAHVLFRLRIGGGLGRGRPVAAVVLLALLPVATNVTSLAALGMVTFVCVALITYEVLRHREERRLIRDGRDEVTERDIAGSERPPSS